MKIRVISDLHIDINDRYPLDLHKDDANDIYTLVAGDISGYPEKNVEWLKRNVNQGAFICGNHDAYSTLMPIEDVKDLYHREFPENSNIAFFDNDVGAISKEIAENIVLVADVLYTDYRFPIEYWNPNGDVQKNMKLVDPYFSKDCYLNDFKYCKCKKRYEKWNDQTNSSKAFQDGEYRLVPPWYLEHHLKAFKKMTEIIEKNPDKDIIVMTHHCLSPKCIDASYNDDMTNASYVSDKEKWILSHPNIKCIVSGHIHSRKSFKIGNCLYAMNPLGYCSKQLMQFDELTCKRKMWTPNCFIDTDSWNIEWEDWENEAWKKQSDKDYQKMIGLANFFF